MGGGEEEEKENNKIKQNRVTDWIVCAMRRLNEDACGESHHRNTETERKRSAK